MKFADVRLLRQEATKITWPSFREAAVTTGIVLLMMSVAGILLAGVDYILGAFDQFLVTL